MLRTARVVEPGERKSKCDDIVGEAAHPGGLVVALADGVTGLGSGRIAAQMFVDRMLVLSPDVVERDDALKAAVDAVDLEISQAEEEYETTGIVAVVRDDMVYGASVGDSEAWLVPSTGHARIKLTDRQERKPRLGSGAIAVSFEPHALGDGVLFLASDGVLNWLPEQVICETLRSKDRARIPQMLRDRLFRELGHLPDDFAVFVAWNDGDA